MKTRKIQTSIYTTHNIQTTIAHTQINKDMLIPLRDGPTIGRSVASEVTIFSVAVEILRLRHWIDLTHTDQIKSPPRFIISRGMGKE